MEKEKQNKYKREYYKKNHEKVRMYHNSYRKKYDVEHKEQKKENAKKLYWKNPQKNRDRVSEYRKNNREKVCAYLRKYRKESGYFENKYKTDVQYRLTYLIRRSLNKAIKGNARKGSPVKLLGCSIKEFKFYLEGKFQDGMTWENWSYRGWHIDHIIPLAFFDLQNEEQLKIACHYTNLQPLWAFENMSKGAKILTKYL